MILGLLVIVTIALAITIASHLTEPRREAQPSQVVMLASSGGSFRVPTSPASSSVHLATRPRSALTRPNDAPTRADGSTRPRDREDDEIVDTRPLGVQVRTSAPMQAKFDGIGGVVKRSVQNAFWKHSIGQQARTLRAAADLLRAETELVDAQVEQETKLQTARLGIETAKIEAESLRGQAAYRQKEARATGEVKIKVVVLEAETAEVNARTALEEAKRRAEDSRAAAQIGNELAPDERELRRLELEVKKETLRTQLAQEKRAQGDLGKPAPTRKDRAQKVRDEGMEREQAILAGRAEKDLSPQEQDALGAIRNETAQRLRELR